MRVFIIAAVTADGFIGRGSTHSADWTGKADKKVFVELTKQAGVMVMGSRTFATINRALPGRLSIVYTRSPEKINVEGVEVTDRSPAELIKELEGRGFSEVAICGGSTIYRQFLTSGVVTDIYLTVVPKLFGQGLSLFDAEVDTNLSLESSELLEDGAVLLHYTTTA